MSNDVADGSSIVRYDERLTEIRVLAKLPPNTTPGQAVYAIGERLGGGGSLALVYCVGDPGAYSFVVPG